jgi:GNAT superfamily N-acetyltransferase
MPADPDDIVIERFENLPATALYSAGLRLREIHLFVEEEVSARDHETTDSLCVHFVAHCEGAVVGTVQYEPESNRLRQMVVAPEFRGRGLGAGLVRRVAEEARTRGHSELLVHAWSRARGSSQLVRGTQASACGAIACVSRSRGSPTCSGPSARTRRVATSRR